MTQTRTTHPPLNAEQLEAITLFAREEGRTWKATLSDVYWYNARIWWSRADIHCKANYGYILHGLRNSHGPSWLMGFKLPKAAK